MDDSPITGTPETDVNEVRRMMLEKHARTQALAGFKSGDIRALVATDIAARGKKYKKCCGEGK